MTKPVSWKLPQGVLPQASSIARFIDHTLLRPDATAEAIRQLTKEAAEYSFTSVCVNPYWVRLAKSELAGTDVMVATVVGFPLGANETAIKVAETAKAIESGADEIDMVMNIGETIGGRAGAVERDIRAVVEAAGARTVKVILETGLLADGQIREASLLAKNAGAGFVKTSTGFGPRGATVEDVRLMRATVGAAMGVKASGGIRTLSDCLQMLEAGANRIGTSAGVAILRAVSS